MKRLKAYNNILKIDSTGFIDLKGEFDLEGELEEHFQTIQEELGTLYGNYFSKKIDENIVAIILSCTRSFLEISSLTYGLIEALKDRENSMTIIVSDILPEKNQDELRKYLNEYKKYNENTLIKVEENLKDFANQQGLLKIDSTEFLDLEGDLEEHFQTIQEELGTLYGNYFSKKIDKDITTIVLSCTGSFLELSSLTFGLMAALPRGNPIEIIVSRTLLKNTQDELVGYLNEYNENKTVTITREPLTPKPLKEICIKYIIQNSALFGKDIEGLPSELQEEIKNSYHF